jgi:hypothetical protein
LDWELECVARACKLGVRRCGRGEWKGMGGKQSYGCKEKENKGK